MSATVWWIQYKNTIQYKTKQNNTIQYNTIQYNTIQDRTENASTSLVVLCCRRPRAQRADAPLMCQVLYCMGPYLTTFVEWGLIWQVLWNETLSEKGCRMGPYLRRVVEWDLIWEGLSNETLSEKGCRMRPYLRRVVEWDLIWEGLWNGTLSENGCPWWKLRKIQRFLPCIWTFFTMGKRLSICKIKYTWYILKIFLLRE
jgi:hypothetical protein